MKNLIIATAQFETQSGNKKYNLSRIKKLSEEARSQGASVVSFHELSITGYTFLKDLSLDEISNLAEEVPSGASADSLIKIAKSTNLHILAGLVERDQGRFYNTYICVNGEGIVAKFRKLHPFISRHLSPGGEYVHFEIQGWKCSILICYDNNVIENVRAVSLMDAQILFAPHVTMCTPSPMPGRGYIDQELWNQRKRKPEILRREFDGPKGRQWLMRWLPARAYDNGIYIVFSNPVGMEGDQVKNGNSLILDPFGDILTEISSFDDQIACATCEPEKLELAGGYRYKKARRPELYREIIGMDNDSTTKPVWIKD